MISGNAQSQTIAASMQQQSSSMDDIRRLADSDEREALRQATQQFEALFVQMMLKTMRATVGESSLHSSSATKTFREMQDSEMAKHIGATGGLGLTKQIIDSVFQQVGMEEPVAIEGEENAEEVVENTSQFLQQRGLLAQ